MFLDRKPLVYVWGPLYRHAVAPAVERLVVRTTAELTAGQDRIERQQREAAAERRQILERLSTIEAEFRATRASLRDLEALVRDASGRSRADSALALDTIDALETATADRWSAIERLILAFLSERNGRQSVPS